MQAKLIFCNFPADDPQAMINFYGALLGNADFARSPTDQVESYQQLISPDGIDLKITKRQNARETVSCHFAVDDLAAAVTQLTAAGGQVVIQSEPLPLSPDVEQQFKQELHKADPSMPASNTVGQWALVRDPSGNLVGLSQLEPQAQRHFKAGKFRTHLSPDQVTEQQNVKHLAGHMKKKP